MRIQRPTITQITELKGDGASLTGSFSGSFATWDGVTDKPDNIISSSTQLSVVTDVATTISGSVTATSASIAEDIAALTGSFSSSLAGRVTTEEVNVDLVQAHQTNLLASTGSNYAHIANLNAATGSNYAHIANLNASTGSNYAHIANLNAATGSQYSHTSNIHTYTGSLKSAITISGTDTTLLGNLTVQGTTTTVESTTITMEDNILQLNGTLATNGGIHVLDNNSAGVTGSLIYSSVNNRWEAGNQEGTDPIATYPLAFTGTDIISQSVLSSAAQGEVAISTNGAAQAAIDLGLQAADSPTFAGLTVNGAITVTGNVDGRDVSTDGTKLDTIEENADVTDTTNVTAAGVLMDSELTNESAVKAINQGLTTTSDVQFDSFGVGTAASGTTGEIRATGDITAYYSSDERLKENFKTLDGALDKVNQLNGYEFDWKDGIEDVVSKKGHDIGVKAQEVQALYPELVHERDNGYLAVDYVKLTAVLLHAVKELSAKVDELSK